jgi:hypothetical protein
MSYRTTRKARREGKVAVLLAISMTAVVSMLALSLDGGALLSERRHAQAVADSAALAAASDLYYKYWVESGWDTQGTARASALEVAAANGYANDGTHSTVTVHIPPESGPFLGRPGYAEVIVKTQQERGFSNIFGRGAITVSARAVSIGAPIAGDVGILVLDPSAKSAFNANGSGVTTVNGTPIVVNSTHSEGSIAGGGGSVAAMEFSLTGGYTTTGGGEFIGPIYTERRPMEDPLADLPVPNPLAMSKQSTRKIQYTNGSETLSPGVYKGGISVSGTGSLTLQPGVYYMDGGGFSFSGQGSLYGDGVMIYNAPGNGNADGISVTGQGAVTLTGMKTGIYEGMTFFQDRNANVTGTVSGTGGGTSITGTFYFAGSLLNISGNGGVVNMGSQYISRQLNLGGNGDIFISWSPDKVARRRTITLVE